MAGPVPLESVSEVDRAAIVLHPIRLAILRHAGQPTSATELGLRLGLARQKVHYHLRRLARSGFVKRAGRHRRRNMIEQRYVISARGFLLAPSLLGPLGADWRSVEDVGSPAYLLALCAQVQTDLLRFEQANASAGKGAEILSIKSQFRFETEERREAFARALREAVIGVIARFTSPYARGDGSPGRGEAFRLVLGSYPFPPEPPAPR
jgi:DNA-binding transcriptional ArsR family regulator